MAGGLKGHLMSRKNKVMCHSIGAMNMDELVDVSRGLCRREPDVLIVVCGTNSLYPKLRYAQDGTPIPVKPLTTTEVCDRMRKVITTLEAEFKHTKVVFSNILARDDHANCHQKINEVNDLMSDANIPHVEHNNITIEHLNSGRIHLNRDGTHLLAYNFINFIREYPFSL